MKKLNWQKLLSINQGFDVKFARSGGEAMSVAIRLARAIKEKSSRNCI